jgi:HD superfamily phosphohydrolase
MTPASDTERQTRYPEPVLPRMFCETEQVADPLNTMVPLSVFEKRILACPEMQRLRLIKQLGFVNLVYPAAEYSRFVHSIGVCHEAKCIVDKINRNLAAQPRYRQWRAEGRYRNEDHGPDYESMHLSGIERIVIAAAALLHDLPHAAFSHEIEGVSHLEKDEVVVPSHDDVDENPAFMQYLFNTEVSTLARLIKKCNTEFLKGLRAYAKWCQKIDKSKRCEPSILRLIDDHAIDSDGFVRVTNGEKNDKYIIRFEKDSDAQPEWTKKLPLLGVMIFEIHLFEKQHQWLDSSEQKRCFRLRTEDAQKRSNEQPVRIHWRDQAIFKWRPIPDWFRAYRNDIICNTICADLIDYVKRDGYHTGIVSEMDLKFLDRMLIARGVLPAEKDEKTPLGRPAGHVLAYGDIPRSCEHVVFDVHDHKRGILRQSVFTEVLGYLQARYLLCERVYGHRVVEGARAMLQRAIALLALSTDRDGARQPIAADLHPQLSENADGALLPGDDLSLLRWVQTQSSSQANAPDDQSQSHGDALKQAKELVTLIEHRRIFREAVIIDGVDGYDGKLSEGPEEACQRLANAFRPSDEDGKKELRELLTAVDMTLRDAWDMSSSKQGIAIPEVTCIIGIQEWGKRYKVPLVLMADPSAHSGNVLPGIEILPLCKRKTPRNIAKQLDAMHTSYDSLWRVYVFVHPVFHVATFASALKGNDKSVESLVLAYANEHTAVKWSNALHFSELLPREGEDLDIQEFIRGGESVRKSQEAETQEERDASKESDFQRAGSLILQIHSGLQGLDGDTLPDGTSTYEAEAFAELYLEGSSGKPKANRLQEVALLLVKFGIDTNQGIKRKGDTFIGLVRNDRFQKAEAARDKNEAHFRHIFHSTFENEPGLFT